MHSDDTRSSSFSCITNTGTELHNQQAYKHDQMGSIIRRTKNLLLQQEWRVYTHTHIHTHTHKLIASTRVKGVHTHTTHTHKHTQHTQTHTHTHTPMKCLYLLVLGTSFLSLFWCITAVVNWLLSAGAVCSECLLAVPVTVKLISWSFSWLVYLLLSMLRASVDGSCTCAFGVYQLSRLIDSLPDQ